MLLILALGCGPASIKFDSDTGSDDSGDTLDSEGDDTDTYDSDTDTDSGDTDTSKDTAETGDTSVIETGDSGDTSVGISGPCADGGWANASDESVLVLSTGDDSIANGTMSAPFGTVTAALSYAASAGNVNILIGPGTFIENVALQINEYAGFVVSGCGSDETTLTSDGITSTFYVGGIEGVQLSDLAIEGGDQGVYVNGGTLNVMRVAMSGALEQGVYLTGGATVGMSDVSVESSGSYGIHVDGAATVVLIDATITNADQAGVFVEDSGSEAFLEGVEITDTQGAPGFGVYAGEGSIVQAEDSVISGGMTAGVMGYDALSISLVDTTISDVAASDTSLEPVDQHSDGVVVMTGGQYDPAGYVLAIDGLVVSDVGRAGVIASDVTVTELAGVSISAGYDASGVSVYLQSGATMGATSPDSYVSLAAGDSLAIDWNW